MTASTQAPAASAAGVRSDSVPAVRTSGLTRHFGAQVAVDGIALEVPRGAVYGFLGPNGSGKTTTIRMLLGLIRPTAGEIEILGETMPDQAGAVLPRVGALIEGPAFHPYLTGLANLRRLDRADATADPRTSGARIDEALARVGLTAAGGKKYRNYSLGMKQRLGLAAALLRPRDLLVLDEPTNGLDPQGTREVRRLVRDLAAEGLTVLVSSHLLSEIQQVATHVGIMSAGRLLRQGPLADVLSAGTETVRVETPDLDRAAAALRTAGFAPTVLGPATLTATLENGPVEDVAQLLVTAGVRLRGLIVERSDLEDLFVAVTGEGFDVQQ
jgi:ABC-2 type transport system ATP-binding protein